MIKFSLASKNVSDDILLGINDKLTKDEYIWSDGTEETDWSSFHTGVKPYNESRYPNCLHMSYASNTWLWYDQSCDDAYNYICEKRLLPVDFGKSFISKTNSVQLL